MEDGNRDLLALLLAGVAAVEPGRAVRRLVSIAGPVVHVGPYELGVDGRLQVLALGKAAAAMVGGLADALPNVSIYGTAVTQHGRSDTPDVVTLHGSHPVPDAASLAAGRRLLAAAAVTPEDLPTVFLVSGGGSALAEAPLPGVTLEWVGETTETLLRSGADIEEINTIRRHVSALKGGGLAAALRGPHVTVAMSDVIGSPPHAIASGPTVADPTRLEDVRAIADRYGLELPEIAALAHPAGGSRFVVAADGAVAASAVVTAGESLRLVTEIHSTTLTGEASEMARRAVEVTNPGSIGVFTGETTVTVAGTGMGGRNQEAALAAAISIAGTTTRFAAIGTDGIDGMSPAAGAIVDGETVARGRALGLDAAAALVANDSFGYLAAVDATIVTGPTGTNVGDLWLVDRTDRDGPREPRPV